MGSDGCRVEVGGAGVGGVGVRLVQTGGVRAEGAVDEEVTGGADRTQGADFVDVLLGPVADDPGARLLCGEPQQPGEVVLGGDVRARALVDGADTEGGGVGERDALGPGALLPRDGAEGGGTDGVVGVAGKRAVLVPGACGDPGTRSRRAVVTTAEWTSMRERYSGRPPVASSSSARVGGRPPGQRAASQP